MALKIALLEAKIDGLVIICETLNKGLRQAGSELDNKYLSTLATLGSDTLLAIKEADNADEIRKILFGEINS